MSYKLKLFKDKSSLFILFKNYSKWMHTQSNKIKKILIPSGERVKGQKFKLNIQFNASLITDKRFSQLNKT